MSTPPLAKIRSDHMSAIGGGPRIERPRHAPQKSTTVYLQHSPRLLPFAAGGGLLAKSSTDPAQAARQIRTDGPTAVSRDSCRLKVLHRRHPAKSRRKPRSNRPLRACIGIADL